MFNGNIANLWQHQFLFTNIFNIQGFKEFLSTLITWTALFVALSINCAFYKLTYLRLTWFFSLEKKQRHLRVSQHLVEQHFTTISLKLDIDMASRKKIARKLARAPKKSLENEYPRGFIMVKKVALPSTAKKRASQTNVDRYDSYASP